MAWVVPSSVRVRGRLYLFIYMKTSGLVWRFTESGRAGSVLPFLPSGIASPLYHTQFMRQREECRLYALRAVCNKECVICLYTKGRFFHQSDRRVTTVRVRAGRIVYSLRAACQCRFFLSVMKDSGACRRGGVVLRPLPRRSRLPFRFVLFCHTVTEKKSFYKEEHITGDKQRRKAYEVERKNSYDGNQNQNDHNHGGRS